MYQSSDLTGNLLLIHRAMVDGELRLSQPDQPRFPRIELPRPLVTARRVAARGLIALGMRLDSTAGMPAPTAPSLRG